ncbi:MAG: hypothetical protein PHC94_09405, partial [Methylobacter sp.]|nr:hypothetical protein [Methylobacter sp.]
MAIPVRHSSGKCNSAPGRFVRHGRSCQAPFDKLRANGKIKILMAENLKLKASMLPANLLSYIDEIPPCI